MEEIKYPANCVVHWATGPVNCCEGHANALRGLGSHVAVTELEEPAECTNCVNENKANS